jgi:hypothetical protein
MDQVLPITARTGWGDAQVIASNKLNLTRAHLAISVLGLFIIPLAIIQTLQLCLRQRLEFPLHAPAVLAVPASVPVLRLGQGFLLTPFHAIKAPTEDFLGLLAHLLTGMVVQCPRGAAIQASNLKVIGQHDDVFPATAYEFCVVIALFRPTVFGREHGSNIPQSTGDTQGLKPT